MPKPRKPIELLAASGALKRNPGRYRDRLTAPTNRSPLGPAPAHLSEEERAQWERIVAMCPAGVLTAADAAIVELTAHLWVQIRSPAATAAVWSQFRSCLQQLGLTPATRSTVSVPAGPEDNNPFVNL